MEKNWQSILLAFIAGLCGAMTYNGVQGVWSPSRATSPQIEEASKVVFTHNGSRLPHLTTSPDFVQASAASTPCVVFIKTVSEEKFRSFDLFDFYFGGGGNSRQSTATGSGVIFTADGYIVTNHHVIENAEKIEVVHQRKTYTAKLIGKDPSSDLAVIKIEGRNLPSIKRGSSREVQVGEWVLAVGNPFNLTSTVTAGIVSAKGRNIQLLGGQFPLESFIQTDAAINPGNSGGALVNSRGELVGINTAILSRTGYYTGYGFAVPVDVVAKVFNDLVQYGETQKAFSGLSVADLDSKLATAYKINADNFDVAIITDVQAGSEAERVGIREGDLIVKVNNDIVTGKSSFEELMSYYRPGDKVKFSLKSKGNPKEITLTLTNREGTTSITKRELFKADKLGAELESVSKVEREKLGIESGVRVVRITGRLAQRLGFQEGTIITAINKQAITTPSQLESMLLNASGRVIIEVITPEGTRGYYSFYF